MESYISISPEIRQALSSHQPVVALESTIISHGMTYPRNFETALAVEQIVRDQGAIPATIALMNGKIIVGLSQKQIRTLAFSGKVQKVSRRDIPFVLQNADLLGATTVAATMIVAKMVGIPIFATGGIGGVHRGAQQSFDVSADLQELSQTNVAVVCAGIKSILDIPLTREVLETKGVAIIGYRSDCLPLFHSSQSPWKVDYRYDNPSDIASALRCKWQLGLDGGVVVANPIPSEFDIPQKQIEDFISQALAAAHEEGIEGKEVTPYLLKHLEKITGGKSLEANIALVLNNAKLAAKIACSYFKSTD